MIQQFENRLSPSLSLKKSAAMVAVLGAMLGTGCTLLPPHTPDSPRMSDIVVYHKAEIERADRLSVEVKRLQADLLRAEEALVKVESGLRGNHTRANAVSELAEARILVKHAAEQAPWRDKETAEARNKLAEAERHVQQNNPGAALFFVYRARRIAELGLLEAETVRSQPDTYYVSGDRVNLRLRPTIRGRVLRILENETPVFVERSKGEWLLVRVVSGSAGWIHASLVRR